MNSEDRERDDIFALGAINECEYATLATSNSDGTPYCIPVSPVVIDGSIFFHCALKGKKLDNIMANACVCLSAVRHAKLIPNKFAIEFESAVALGKCEVLTDDQKKITVLRAICEKYAPDNMASFDKAIAKLLSKTNVCEIITTEITHKSKKYDK